MTPFVREWGAGPPVIALHPLGLESSGFERLGRVLAGRGLRTLAMDFPGFGRTPAVGGPLRPDVLAAPVIELARSLEARPIVLGISLGGRVALEAALTAPEAFRAVVPIAPYLPWLRYRPLLGTMALVDPAIAKWLPLERVWPLLRWLAAALEQTPAIRDDELARAGARLVYYASCPTTRASFLSAARELALDPASGEDGVWARLAGLRVPGVFVWAARDRLVSIGFAHRVAAACPQVGQLVLPCAGHWLNGPHHGCLAEAVGSLAALFDEGPAPSTAVFAAGDGLERVGNAWLATRPCRVALATRPSPPELARVSLSAAPSRR